MELLHLFYLNMDVFTIIFKMKQLTFEATSRFNIPSIQNKVMPDMINLYYVVVRFISDDNWSSKLLTI